MLRLALAPLLAVVALAAAAPDPLATARAHLKAGQFDLVIDDLADTSNLDKGAAGAVFADAAAMALSKGDSMLAGLYCERAVALDPKHKGALRTCTTAALKDKRYEDAERFGESLGALDPKDGEVALLRAEAAKARDGWQMVVELLEPFEGEKALAKRVAPMLAEARAKTKAPGASAPAPTAAGSGKDDDVEARLAKAVQQAREIDKQSDLRKEAEATEAKKKWRPLGEKVVLYTLRKCSSCDQVRAWLQQNGVEFEEKDADHSRQAWSEAMKLCAKARQVNCHVPIIVVNGEAVHGSDTSRLSTLLGL
ncbi:MAG: glutaredoxin family protein [Myxococcales bacterium]